MTKKKNLKKSTNVSQESKPEPEPVAKPTESQNDEGTTAGQLTRRQKKNIKKKGKEADDGQPADSEQPKSNSKEANMQKDEGEKPKLSNEDKEGPWVPVAFNKSKRTEVNTQEEKPIKGGKTVNESSSKSTDAQQHANPYKQKKGGKIVNESPKSTDGWKSQETNPYQQPKKGGKSVKESPKAMDTSNNLYKPPQKRDQNWGDKDEKVEFDYFANEVVKSGTGTDNVPKAAKQAESVKRKHEDTFGTTTFLSKDVTEKDYDNFSTLHKERKFKEGNFVKVKEIQDDLFNMPTTFALAHCVAEDMNMGSGIAVQFSQKFKRRDELYQQKQKQGGLAILEDEGRYIYYLVTKKLSNGKPTNHTMWNSLQKLQQHIQNNNVKKLAIPRIGCGLDRLEWSFIKAMIEYTFRNTDVDITVCNFQQPEEESSKAPAPLKQSKCPVFNVKYPIVDIEGGTAIIYFGTVNGDISEDIESLDNKFQIISDYKRSNRKLGDVIQVYRKDQTYSLLGCITRNTNKDPFDFLAFQKCILQIKKSNKNYYEYVGFQAFFDDHDELLLNKISNMLRFSLIKVHVYVCWGGKMLKFMPPERGDFY